MNTIQVMPCVQTSVHRYPENHYFADRNTSQYYSHAVIDSKSGRDHESCTSSRRKKIRRTRARKSGTNKFEIGKFGIGRSLLLLSVCVILINFIGLISKASMNEVPSEYKYYDSITVAYQQDLDDIVDAYCDLRYYHSEDEYIRELYRINNLEYDSGMIESITPGMHIVVPYYSSEIK